MQRARGVGGGGGEGGEERGSPPQNEGERGEAESQGQRARESEMLLCLMCAAQEEG